jgi:type IV pilus assembly protein PilM
LFLGRKEVTGLDIGTSAVKLVELKHTRKGYELKNLGESLLPEEAIVNKVIKKRDAVVDAIASLVDELKLRNKNVAISIAGHGVIIKKVSLPKMSEKELKEAIPWELEQYIPQGVEEVSYDFQILPGETPEGNMDVLIVAAKKDVTNEYVAVVSEAGLNPVVVDVDVFALENMFEFNYPEVNGTVALVNIGASITNVNILGQGVSVFTRDITVGGNQLSELIQKEFSVDYEEAERMKRSIGRVNQISPDLDRILRDFTDLVCGEIKKTLDFFVKTLWREGIERIMIGGGCSKIPYIRETLESLVDSEVDVFNPFKNVFCGLDFDPEYIKDIAPKMGVAVGLALRKAGE